MANKAKVPRIIPSVVIKVFFSLDHFGSLIFLLYVFLLALSRDLAITYVWNENAILQQLVNYRNRVVSGGQLGGLPNRQENGLNKIESVGVLVRWDMTRCNQYNRQCFRNLRDRSAASAGTKRITKVFMVVLSVGMRFTDFYWQRAIFFCKQLCIGTRQTA